jgi:hypothetical protein
MVGLAAVLLVAAMVAAWADDLLLSPSHWETTSTQLLANPTVRTSTATYLADQVDERLDLSALSGSTVASALGPFAGTTVATARSTIYHAMYRALGLASVQALWARANRGAATAVLTIVNRRTGPVATAGAPVTVSLGPILRVAAADAHLPAAVVTALPADAGTLTVVRSDQLHTVQSAGRAVRDLARGLVIFVPLLWLAALALARGRRRRTLAAIGITAALAGALVLGARALLVTPAADAISGDPSLRRVIAAAVTTITASLGHVALVVGIVGLVIAGSTGLAGQLSRRPQPR